jgi:hypothetical protein
MALAIKLPQNPPSNLPWVDNGGYYIFPADQGFIEKHTLLNQLVRIKYNALSKYCSNDTRSSEILNQQHIIFSQDANYDIIRNESLFGIELKPMKADQFNKYLSTYKPKDLGLDKIIQELPVGVNITAGGIVLEDDGRVWITQTRGNKNPKLDGTEFTGFRGVRFFELPIGTVCESNDKTERSNDGILKGVMREVFEETGMVFEPTELFEITYLKHRGMNKLIMHFVGKRTGGAPWSWIGSPFNPISEEQAKSGMANETITTNLVSVAKARKMLKQNQNVRYDFVLTPKFFSQDFTKRIEKMAAKNTNATYCKR